MTEPVVKLRLWHPYWEFDLILGIVRPVDSETAIWAICFVKINPCSLYVGFLIGTTFRPHPD